MRVKKSSTTIYCENKAKFMQAGHVKEAGYREKHGGDNGYLMT